MDKSDLRDFDFGELLIVLYYLPGYFDNFLIATGAEHKGFDNRGIRAARKVGDKLEVAMIEFFFWKNGIFLIFVHACICEY